MATKVKSKSVERREAAQQDSAVATETAPEAEVQKPVGRIAESREALKSPLPAGQKFFEAPDGWIGIGEESQTYMFYTPDGGHEIRINPRRA